MTTPQNAQQPPALQFSAQPDTPLAQWQWRYPALKDQAEVAAAALKECTDAIKLELATAASQHGAARVDLVAGNGCPTLQLDYRETWRIDSKRLKSEQPELYVTYAKKSGAWYLNPVKDGT